MLKRMLCLVLTMLLLFSVTGCSKEDAKEGEYQIYYTNMDRTKLMPEAYDSTGFKGEDLVQELLGRLKSAPDSLQLRQTIPKDVVINSVKINGVYLYIDFSQEDFDTVEDYINAIIHDHNYLRPSYALKYKTPIEFRILSGFK